MNPEVTAQLRQILASQLASVIAGAGGSVDPASAYLHRLAGKQALALTQTVLSNTEADDGNN